MRSLTCKAKVGILSVLGASTIALMAAAWSGARDGEFRSSATVARAEGQLDGVRVILAEPTDRAPSDQVLYILDPATGARKALRASADSFAMVRTSPNGSLVAALARDMRGLSSDAILRLFDLRTTRLIGQTTIPWNHVPLAIEWSPDGKYVAWVGAGVGVLGVGGAVIGSSPPASPGDPKGETVVATGGQSWAPDGRWFAAVTGDQLVIIGTDPSSKPRSLDLSAAGFSGPFYFTAWQGPRSVVLGGRVDGGRTAATVIVSVPDAGALVAALGSDSTADRPIPGGLQPDGDTVASLVPGSHVVHSRNSSDGRTTLFELTKDGRVWVVVRTASGNGLVLLDGLTPASTRGGDLYDVATGGLQ